jgi:hypothetical protein
MKKSGLALFSLIILFVLTGIQTLHAQPPPPPPPGGGPPCWPPPCIPVDNGIIVAISVAVIFGAFFVFRMMKFRTAEK